MYGRAMLHFPLHKLAASLLGARCVRAQGFAHLRPTSVAAFQRAHHLDRPRAAALWQSVRLLSSEAPPSSPTLIISANCARRIAHLQKQQATAGSGKSLLPCSAKVFERPCFAAAGEDLKLRLAVEGGGCSGLQFVAMN